MNKPEKQRVDYSRHSDPLAYGYNQACDDWEKWIVERLEKIPSIEVKDIGVAGMIHIEELDQLIQEIKER